MKNQVAIDDIIGAEGGKRAQIDAVPAGLGRPEYGHRPGVEPIDLPAPAMKLDRQFARARADFKDGFARRGTSSQRASEPPVVTHQRVDDAQVTAVLARIGMVMR